MRSSPATLAACSWDIAPRSYHLMAAASRISLANSSGERRSAENTSSSKLIVISIIDVTIAGVRIGTTGHPAGKQSLVLEHSWLRVRVVGHASIDPLADFWGARR